MEEFVTFLAGFISWNVLVWLLIGASSIVIARLVVRFTGYDLHELGVLLFSMAAMMGFIIWFIGHLMGNVIMPLATTWYDPLINQCTVHSIYINLLAVAAHFLFVVRAGQWAEDRKKREEAE